MKKKKRVIFIAILGASLGIFSGMKNNQDVYKDLTTENLEALTEGDNIHAGGTADKKYPIWVVTYETAVSVPPAITNGCYTGGEYKCKDGKYPHGM